MSSPHTPEMRAASIVEKNSIAQNSAEIETPLTPPVQPNRLILESLLEDLDVRTNRQDGEGI